MEPTAKQDLYFKYLEQEGYRPEIDPDGDVQFMSEGGRYYLSVDDDASYFQLQYPNFWSLDSPEELQRALEAANYASRQTKVVKLYVRPDGKNTSASIELFLDPLESFPSIFQRCLRATRFGVETFADRMRGSAHPPDPNAPLN